MKPFTAKEILVIERFLDETKDVGKDNNYVQIYQSYQQQQLKVYKAFAETLFKEI